MLDIDQLIAGTLTKANIQFPAPAIPAQRNPRALAVAVGRPFQRRRPLLRFNLGKVLQLLRQGLLLDLQLLFARHVLQAATTAQIGVHAAQRLAQLTGLLQAFQPRLDQLAARPQYPCLHLLAGQPALNKHGAPTPAANTPAIVGQALQLQLDTLADGGRCIGRRRRTRTSAPAFHAGPS